MLYKKILKLYVVKRLPGKKLSDGKPHNCPYKLCHIYLPAMVWIH